MKFKTQFALVNTIPGKALAGGRLLPYPFGFLLLVSMLAACNVTRHLDSEKGERLLVKNSIELNTEENLSFSKRTALEYELSSLYKIKPNERPPLAFGARWRVWLYYRYQSRESKFSNWIMRRVAEAPAIYDDDLTQSTAKNLENYMRQHGYFDAHSFYETNFFGKYKSSTKYTIEMGPLYTIESVSFFSLDSNVQRILYETAGKSRIRPGSPMDGRQFEAEKLRITSELKNRGYAFFIPNFVNFVGDSTGTKTRVTVEVQPETDSTLHKTYEIGDVAVFSSLVPDYSSIRIDTTINGVYFASSEPKFQVKPSTLYNAISVLPGQLYKQEDIETTIRKLNALGIFKFVSVRPFQDSINPEKLNIAVSFSSNKRLAIGGDVELNSSSSSVSGRLVGVAGTLSARNRNVFRGAELIQTNLQYNLEFDISNRDRLFFSQEFKFQNDLTFPRFIDYFGFWNGLWKIQVGKNRLVTNTLLNRLKTEGQTQVSLSYNYLDLINYYSYNLFNASIGYRVRAGQEHVYNFNNFGVDVLQPKLRPEFDIIFGENEFLKRSFGNQLFTGFIMRSFDYTLLGKPNVFGERWYFHLNTELSGLEIFLANRLWSAAFTEQTWGIENLEFSKYLRLDMDGSYTRDFPRNITAAVRIGSGFVVPYGDTRDAPYVKQFFVGGPSSLRAWRIREIGPGSYNDSNPPINQPFYQAANFRFEFNGELRFPLLWWIKGAVFLDGGNVWTFKKDPDRPGSELRWNSVENLALGTGFGLRGDFEFFVIRFDLGIKVKSPYKNENNTYWVFPKLNKFSLSDLNPNLSVGYPF